MSETTSAPAPTPATVPTPTTTEPAPITSEPPAPAPEATPIATTAAAVAGPTPAPTSTSAAEVSAPAESTAAPEAIETIAVPEPVQSVPTPTAAPIKSAQVTVEEAKDTDGKDASVEPQNKLTSKFTKEEWEALNKFRDQLPEIFAQAFPGNLQAKQTSINLWGVELDPQNPKKDARVSVVLVKFLRARNLSFPDARDMFVGTLRWRESFNVDAALKEEFPQDVFGSLGHIFGKDTGGRPIIYNIYGGDQDLKAAFGDVQRFIRWRVALMERSVFLLDFNEVDQTVQVHDYEGVSLSSRDANSKAAASEASNIFQSHYPEMLHKKFFINVPTILSWIFWAFKPLLSANTLAKMSVVGTGQDAIRKALVAHVKEEELPKRYGGLADAF